MAKKSSAIIGVTLAFRKGGKTYDPLRAWIYKNGVFHPIGSKVHPTLKQINKYLREKRFRAKQAESDPEFSKMKQRLEQELRSAHGLSTYKAIERLDLQTKDFNFETALDEFESWKQRTGVSYSYRRTMEIFWLPFFIKTKSCIHPNEFIEYGADAELYVRSHKTKAGAPISFHSYNSYFKVLNQFIEFCLIKKIISKTAHFKLWHTPTIEEKKRGQLKRKRSTDTYDRHDVIEIKEKIDRTFATNPTEKLRAYGYLFGVITGLRQGNVLGLKAEDLFPDASIPHFRVSDNVVSGYSRGVKGMIVFQNATKTTTAEDGEILLPLLQPSVGIAVDVARYLKAHYKPKERVCPSSPGSFYRGWKRIAKICGFKFLNPHNWKHSYATIGADHLKDWYNDNPRLLQLCCLHSSYRMTEKYIKKKYPKSLMAWAKTANG